LLGAGKVTVTVAGEALAVFCEFTALYWKVTVADAVQVGAHAGTAVNEPSALNVTLPPDGDPTGAAVSASPDGSLSFPKTPGGLMCSREMALVYASALAVGAPPNAVPQPPELVASHCVIVAVLESVPLTR
jgi:hypothetical protein